MSKKFQYLPFVFFVALLPALILRDYTPINELRYLSIADEALRQGHFFAFTNHGLLYADKPPLYFWIIMMGKYIFGKDCIFFLSLFSFIPAMVILHTMNHWVTEYSDNRINSYSSIVLMSCGLFLGLSMFVRMDMLMCMFIVLSFYTFWQMLNGRLSDRKGRVLFSLYIFLGVFTKGPFAILFPLISTIVYLISVHKRKELSRFWGWQTWTMLLLLFSTWFFLAWREGGSQYINNLLFHQTFGRAYNAFHHREMIYFYFLYYWPAFAPWSLLFIITFIEAHRQHIHFNDYERFFAVISICTFITLSLCSSKLSIYMLPMYPFIAYLAMSLLQRIKVTGWLNFAVILPALIGCIISPTCFFIPYTKGLISSGNVWCIMMLISIFAASLTSLIVLLRHKNIMASIKYLAIGMFSMIFFFGLSLPFTNHYFGYGDLCREVKTLSQPNNIHNFYAWGMTRPENMDIYIGQTVSRATTEDILSGKCRGIIMISEHDMKKDAAMRDFVSRQVHHNIYDTIVIEYK
jgi:hypothetical protein